MLEPNSLLQKDKEIQPVYLPASVIHSLKKELNVHDSEVADSIQTIIQKAIEDRIAENNSKVFTEAETKELEEDLKGLGYI